MSLCAWITARLDVLSLLAASNWKPQTGSCGQRSGQAIILCRGAYRADRVLLVLRDILGVMNRLSIEAIVVFAPQHVDSISGVQQVTSHLYTDDIRNRASVVLSLHKVDGISKQPTPFLKRINADLVIHLTGHARSGTLLMD